jgi:hypothetical protein
LGGEPELSNLNVALLLFVATTTTMSKRLSKRQLREQQELQTLGGSGKGGQEVEEAAGNNAKEEAVIEESIESSADVDEEGVAHNSAGAGLFSQVSTRKDDQLEPRLVLENSAW